MTNSTYIGIDIGGTAIVAGIMKRGTFVRTVDVPTNAAESLEIILIQLYSAIDSLITPEVKGIGIGCPGFIDADKGVIVNINNIPAFKGVDLKLKVQAKYNIPVFMSNDANCFVLGEAFSGAASGCKNVVGITLGTGLGGGVIINKKIYNGYNGAAGEIGCIAYKEGIIEDYCSSKFFTTHHQSTGIELYNKAEKGDIVAKVAFIELGQHLGWLINTVLYVLAPEAIVVGGSISRAFIYIEPGIQKQLAQFLFNDLKTKVQIKKAELENAGLVGAASLCISELG